MPNLSIAERVVIQNLLLENKNPIFISKCLRRSKSTIYREIIKVNPDTNKYEAKYAHNLTFSNMSKVIYKGPPEDIVTLIEDKLCIQWSPEQISGWLKKNHNITVGYNWIYKHIREDKKAGGELHNHLRHGNYIKKGKEYLGSIKDRVCIEKRPDIINDRKRLGDLEIDLVVGPKNRGAILTVIDRKSRQCAIQSLTSKKADVVSIACLEAVKRLGVKTQSITSDNGTEFTDHKDISTPLGIKYFFAHPYASYERGSIENLNGLVRQYIPKKTSFKGIDQNLLNDLEKRLNERPRKILKYLTPNEYVVNMN